MKRVIVCGLFGILFTGTAINGLDKITNAFQKLKDSKVGQAVNKFAQSQAGQAIKQVAITVVLPKIKEKISNMKTAVTSKNAEAINGLNSSQAGLANNANILSQSGNTTVINAVNSANASAGQIIAQLQSLGINLNLLSSASQLNTQSTTVNLNSVKSLISSFITNIKPHLENIKAQLSTLQGNSVSLNASQQIAFSNYSTCITQLTNLAQASAFALGISSYVDQIVNQLQLGNVTTNDLKTWVSELAAYGSTFQQSLNAGGISLDAKMAALISGSDLVTALTASGVDMSQTNMLTQPATQQPVVQPTIQSAQQPVIPQSQPVQQTPIQQATILRRVSRSR